MKKYVGTVALLMILSLAFFSCIADDDTDYEDENLLVVYAQSAGLGRFTASGGQDYQRGWRINSNIAAHDGALPLYLVLEVTGGGDGLGGTKIVWSLDEWWVQSEASNDWQGDGPWASEVRTFVVDLTRTCAYDDILEFFERGDDVELVVGFNSASGNQVLTVAKLKAAHLIFNKSDLLVSLSDTADNAVVNRADSYHNNASGGAHICGSYRDGPLPIMWWFTEEDGSVLKEDEE